MKKFIGLLILIPALLNSCNKEEISPETTLEGGNQNLLSSTSGKTGWDKIYEIRDGKEIDITSQYNKSKLLSSTNVGTSSSDVQRFYEIATINPTYVYPGSVLSEESINDGLYTPVGYSSLLKDEVTISFSLPVRSMDVAPIRSRMTDAVLDALGDRDFSGRQSQVFTYKMKEISYYREAKLAFGANINVAQIFNMQASVASGQIQQTSAIIVDFSQIYFNVAMDIPYDGNIFKDEPTRQSFLSQNPVYVNTVNYGRKGVILVESTENHSTLSTAVRAGFNAGIVNGEISVDAETERILKSAQITICIIGGDGAGAVRTVKGFHEFQEFIVNGGVYSTEVYGVPISFGGAYASNNGMFQTEFEL